MKKSFIATVAGASLILTVIALFSKGIGFIREIIYANKFGLTDDYELFLVATAVPIFINTAILYLTQNYFIPLYNQALRQSKHSAIEFFNFTFWWFLIISLIICILLAAISQHIVNTFIPQTPFSNREIASNLFLLFLITMPFNAVISVISAKMQADFKFIFPAIIQIMLNLIVIGLIVIFAKSFKVYILPLSFVAAYFLSSVILILVSMKEISFNIKVVFNIKEISDSYKVFFYLLIIEILSLSYMLLDRYFYNVLPTGGIAALNYAIVIIALPVSIFSIPFLTTVFSKFSQNSQFNHELNKDDYKFALTINNFIMIPVSILILFGGEVFLKLFYEHGQFTDESTRITASTLKYYTIGLLLYSSYLIVVKYLYSLKQISTVLMISVLAFIIKLLFNFILVDNLKQDGLALSTSLVYIVSFIIGFYFIKVGINFSERNFYLKSVLYFMFNSIVSLLMTYSILSIMNTQTIFKSILALLLFISIYLSNSYLLHDKEIMIIESTVKRFFSRLKLKFGN